MDGYTQFVVVVNDEEQYSIWPSEREIPAGWSAVGFDGSRTECQSPASRAALRFPRWDR
jgi:MbtH protein